VHAVQRPLLHGTSVWSYSPAQRDAATAIAANKKIGESAS
jgi:hypothetical protein